MRRILLTGKNGQIGWELQRTLAPLGEVFAFDRQGMDLSDPDSIRRTIRDTKPDLIVNAAAYTAVDKAEEEPGLAMTINGIAPGIMAEEAKRLDALLIHYSTDYVFDGTKGDPYTEEDLPNPINVYGKTKLAGEHAIQQAGGPHLIFRTSWVYGARGKNFLLTILRLAKERDELRIVDDQIGAPTWSRTIAQATDQIIAQLKSSLITHDSLFTEVEGIYNLTASGATSWYGFASAIVGAEAGGFTRGLDHPPVSRKLVPIDTSEYPTLAKRPKNSILSNSKVLREFNVALTGWEAGLRMCLEDYCS